MPSADAVAAIIRFVSGANIARNFAVFTAAAFLLPFPRTILLAKLSAAKALENIVFSMERLERVKRSDSKFSN